MYLHIWTLKTKVDKILSSFPTNLAAKFPLAINDWDAPLNRLILIKSVSIASKFSNNYTELVLKKKNM